MAWSAVGFEEFVASRGSVLLRFAYLLTHNGALAEDLVQDALIKVHRRWGARVCADRPEAYVRRALVNEYLSWRRRRSSTELVGPIPDRAAPDPTNELAERDLVWRLLGGLPRRQRVVLVLRYYEALPDAEIAGLLGCAPGTVRSLATRAFHTLRQDPQIADLGTASGEQR